MDSTLDPALLDAVARLLGQGAPGGLTLSAIADEAGISRTTLHRRGTRLGPLIGAVVDRVSDDLRRELWPSMTSSEPARDRLLAAIEAVLDVFEKHSGVLSALFHVPDGKTPSTPARQSGLHFIEPFERLLRDGQADGSLHCTDPEREAHLVVNGVTWSYLHLRRAMGWSERDAREHVSLLASRYFALP